MTVQNLVQDFLCHIQLERNLSPHTVSQYTRDLRRWVRHLEAQGVPLDTDHVTVQHVRGFVQGLSASGLAPRSVMRFLACLRSFYSFACRFHDLRDNPAAAVMAPRIPQTLPQVLTHTQVAALMEACDESHFRLYRTRDRSIVAVLACLGLRRQELIDLRLDDWDAERRILRVRSGKGGRERLLPLTDELIALVAAWLEVRPKTREPHLFLSRHGRRLAVASLQRMLRRLASAAGMTETPHLHMFRHYAGTAIVNNHASGGVEQARRVLGHLSSETVSIYTHLSVDDLRPAVRDTATLAGIGTRTRPSSAPRLDPGTELMARRLQDTLGQLPDSWRDSHRVVRWLVTEWVRQCLPEAELALAPVTVEQVLFDRQTVAGVSLDTHLAIAEFGQVVARHLHRARAHRAEDLLQIGEELGRGSTGQSRCGEGVTDLELRHLDDLIPDPTAEMDPPVVLATILSVFGQLRAVRVDVPNGRAAIELLVGLLVWEQGLPPLIVPACSRHLWRLVLGRHAGGDATLAVALGMTRLLEIAGTLREVVSASPEDRDQLGDG